MFLDNFTTPSKSLVTTAQSPLPEAISKSYKAALNDNWEEDTADIKTPIDPDEGGVEAIEPPEPLKFKPVPHDPKLDDKVRKIVSEPNVGLNCILAWYPYKSIGFEPESLYWTAKSTVAPCSIVKSYFPAAIFLS